jgi:hypothetical protein
MRQCVLDRDLPIIGNNSDDPNTVATNCDGLAGSSINPVFYSWKKYAQTQTRSLKMSLKSPPTASRRLHTIFNSTPRYCNVKGVRSAFLAISILSVWSLLTIIVVNHRLIVANSNMRIGGSTRDWVEEFHLNFNGPSSPIAHFTFQSSVVKQEDLSKIRVPRKLQRKAKAAAERADFGGLDIDPLPQDGAKRSIKKVTRLTMTEFLDQDAPRDDDLELYYLADDDFSKLNYGSANGEDDEVNGDGCRFVSDYHLNFQNCNIFHEISLEQSTLKYLGYV